MLKMPLLTLNGIPIENHLQEEQFYGTHIQKRRKGVVLCGNLYTVLCHSFLMVNKTGVGQNFHLS